MKRFFSALLTSFVLVVYLLPIASTCTGNFVASKNSDVYHVSTCYYVDQIYDSNKIWFSTTDAAEKTGRRGCSKCKPKNSKNNSAPISISKSSSEKRYSYSDLKDAKAEGFTSGLARGKVDGYKVGYEEGYTQALIDNAVNNKNELNTAKTYTALCTFAATAGAGIALSKFKK